MGMTGTDCDFGVPTCRVELLGTLTATALSRPINILAEFFSEELELGQDMSRRTPPDLWPVQSNIYSRPNEAGQSTAW
jgi:hypothetical protein